MTDPKQMKEQSLCGKRVEVRDANGKPRQGAVMMVWHSRGHATVLLDDDGSGVVECVRVNIHDLL